MLGLGTRQTFLTKTGERLSNLAQVLLNFKPSMIRARCLHRSGYRFTNSSVDLGSSSQPSRKVQRPKALCSSFGRLLIVSHSFIPLLLEPRQGANLPGIHRNGYCGHGNYANGRFSASTAILHSDSPQRPQILHLSLRSNPIMFRLLQQKEGFYQIHSTR